MDLLLEARVRDRQVPTGGGLPLDQEAREKEVAGDELSAAGKGADRLRLGLADESRRGACGRREARVKAMHEPHMAGLGTPQA